MTLSIQRPDDAERRLQEAADRLNVTAEELASAAVRDFVGALADDFGTAVHRVLKKNRDLYKRLA